MEIPAQTAANANLGPGVSVQSRYIHSDIFERLCRDEDDLVGLVAYGLYQQQKREWISKFELDRGKTPSEQEVKDYCYTFQDSVLSDLRTKSETIIFAVAENIIENRIPEMQSDAFNAATRAEIGKLQERIGNISGYKHHVFGHVVGFITLVLLVWLATLVVHYEPNIGHMLGFAVEQTPAGGLGSSYTTDPSTSHTSNGK